MNLTCPFCIGMRLTVCTSRVEFGNTVAYSLACPLSEGGCGREFRLRLEVAKADTDCA